MVHWLLTAVNTYVLHVEHGNGYQFWSGFGGRTIGVGAIAGLLWHHRRRPSNVVVKREEDK